MEANEQSQEKFVLFELVNTTYGVPSRFVRRLEMIETVTPVPNATPELEGIVLSQGKVIPAVNLRVRFGFPRVLFDIRSRLLVIEAEGRTVGLIVDSAREFRTIHSSEIKPAPQAIANLNGEYIEGIAAQNGRMIIVLKLDEILKSADQAPAQAATELN
jgi:purine-binding chemotaxis protein CheW